MPLSLVRYGSVFLIRRMWLNDHFFYINSVYPQAFFLPDLVDVLHWLDWGRDPGKLVLTSTPSGKLNVYGYYSLNNGWLTAISQIQFLPNQSGQIMLIPTEWGLGIERWMIHWEDDPSGRLFHNWPWRQKQWTLLPFLISFSPSSSALGLWPINYFHY